MLSIGPLKRRSLGRRLAACGVVLMAAAFLSALPGCAPRTTIPVRSWLCYYGSQWGPEVYKRFDLVVLDGAAPPPLPTNQKSRPILLGYVSLGEIGPHSPWWDDAEACRCFVKENPHWGSQMVDVRNRCWQDLFLERMVPAVLRKGFHGVFIDTMDSCLELARENPQRFQGTRESLVEIIRRLRSSHPTLFIAVNRGLPILPEIAPLINCVVVEDLYSYYAGPERGYVRVPEETRRELLAWVEAGRKSNPNLLVLSLDYADPSQTELIREAIRFSKEKGFIPYVSTVLLDQIYFYTVD